MHGGDYPTSDRDAQLCKFNFEWMVNYIYDEKKHRCLAGTILHTIGWHDNTAAKHTQTRNWAGFGTGPSTHELCLDHYTA